MGCSQRPLRRPRTNNERPPPSSPSAWEDEGTPVAARTSTSGPGGGAAMPRGRRADNRSTGCNGLRHVFLPQADHTGSPGDVKVDLGGRSEWCGWAARPYASTQMRRNQGKSSRVLGAWRRAQRTNPASQPINCSETRTGEIADRPQRLAAPLQPERGAHAIVKPCLMSGRLRRRLPVSANRALATAGAMGGVAGSPIPPSAAPLSTMCTSTAGMCRICSMG
jgi:hypothetical protein